MLQNTLIKWLIVLYNIILPIYNVVFLRLKNLYEFSVFRQIVVLQNQIVSNIVV